MKTKQQRTFPAELLQASIKERMDYFKTRKINHRMLSDAFDKAIAALDSSSGPQVVTLTGPTGAGKTTVARRIYLHLLEAHKAEVMEDPSMVPVVGINAVPPNGTTFNWKDFYYRLLEKNGDVLLDRKLNLPRQGNMFPELLFPLPSEGSTVDVLRRSLEKCIRKRRTKYVIIDEGHHLLMVKDHDRLECQFESLKSLSNESGATIVLVGTYRLMDIRDHSGQLVRRSEIIHFPRYDFREKGHQESFGSVLMELQAKMPLEETPNLVADANYYYLKTAGCVGILKDWLARCLEQALKEGRKSFDTEFASRFALDNKGLRTIIEEALAGEAKLADEPLDGIKALLESGKPASTAAQPSLPSLPRPKRRVGERKPVRDVTGGSHVAP